MLIPGWLVLQFATFHQGSLPTLNCDETLKQFSFFFHCEVNNENGNGGRQLRRIQESKNYHPNIISCGYSKLLDSLKRFHYGTPVGKPQLAVLSVLEQSLLQPG